MGVQFEPEWPVARRHGVLHQPRVPAGTSTVFDRIPEDAEEPTTPYRDYEE